MSKLRGFTLIELMIVVAIIAIISAIAFPAYNEYVVKTRRATAAGCLTELSQFMERYRTTSMSYAGAVLPQTACRTDTSQFYTYAYADGQPTASTFTIEATPTGAQTVDTKCATLGVNELGVRTVSGTSSASLCW